MSPIARKPRRQTSALRLPASPGPLAFCMLMMALAVPLLFSDRLPAVAVKGALAALLLAFAIRAIATRGWLPRTAAGWANLAALLLLPLGLWASSDRAASWPVVCKVAAGLAIFYGVAGLARTRWISHLPWALLLAAAALALLVVVGARWSPYVKLPWFPRSLFSLLPRISLPAGVDRINANIGAAALALLIPPAAALALWGDTRRLRLLGALASGAAGAVLLLTQSRLAWLAVALALMTMLAVRSRRWRLILVGMAGLAAVAVALALAVAGRAGLAAVLSPTLGISPEALGTVGGRVGIWTSALAVVREFPLTGVGPGMFERVASVRYPPPELGFNHAHNVFLQAAADFGLGGAVAHLALIVGLGAGLVAALRRTEGGARLALQTGLLGSLIAYVLIGLADAPTVSPYVYAIAFALFGAIAAVSDPPGDGESTRPEPVGD